MRTATILVWLAGPALAQVSPGTNPEANPAANPVELGAVAWMRDFDRAVEAAEASDKPLLVLFQEVPG